MASDGLTVTLADLDDDVDELWRATRNGGHQRPLHVDPDCEHLEEAKTVRSVEPATCFEDHRVCSFCGCDTYRCEICDEEFDSLPGLTGHVGNAHENKWRQVTNRGAPERLRGQSDPDSAGGPRRDQEVITRAE